MIVLDTDVASALIHGEQNQAVSNWFTGLRDEDVYLTSTTMSELIFGVMRLPNGRRKNQLDDDVAALISSFHDRMIDFDFMAALEYGRFVPDRFAIGRPIARDDAQIAACCVISGATLATRNTKDFEQIPGLTVINPWDQA